MVEIESAQRQGDHWRPLEEQTEEELGSGHGSGHEEGSGLKYILNGLNRTW